MVNVPDQSCFDTDTPEMRYALIQKNFVHFMNLLEGNKEVLKTIAELEEIRHGHISFDKAMIGRIYDRLSSRTRMIIEEMIALGGDSYSELLAVFDIIDKKIRFQISGKRSADERQFTLSLKDLTREHSDLVGGKNAQLGEMKSRLGLPVPDGFAITAHAYHTFYKHNDLQAKINRLLTSVNIRNYNDLERISGDIQKMVMSCSIPDEVLSEISQQITLLTQKNPNSFYALRSSALGEDTHFTFAGQYATFLNVKAEDIITTYLRVIASKYTPKALFYILSHSLSEADLAMCVSCITMIDAVSSGVIYTKDPVHPAEDTLLIHSIFGLGRYLVDGVVTPDVFTLYRKDQSLRSIQVAVKKIKMRLKSLGGTERVDIEVENQTRPSLSEEIIKQLAEISLRLEEHYGGPQDIEWCLDKDENIFLLQTRPLRILEEQRQSTETFVAPEEAIIFEGGTTVCPGAGAGVVTIVRSSRDLPHVPDNAVLIAPHAFPGLITMMSRINALVVCIGGTASHMATIAREYGVPTIVGLDKCERFSNGMEVTVDAASCKIYQGILHDLLQMHSQHRNFIESLEHFGYLTRVLESISPLHLLREDDLEARKCRTIHDITRFCHQKGMEEMFAAATATSAQATSCFSVRLKSDIPLPVEIIFIDHNFLQFYHLERIHLDRVAQTPLKPFWDGLLIEGWPAPPPLPKKLGGMAAVTGRIRKERSAKFEEKIFIVLSDEYMIVSLRLGYHFTTIEAMMSDDVNKNYIRMLYKGGGSMLERRTRRIRLIKEVLSPLGFEHADKADYMETTLNYKDKNAIRKKLTILGRLIIMTKQLDMALSNDAIMKWYANDFKKKLDISG